MAIVALKLVAVTEELTIIENTGENSTTCFKQRETRVINDFRMSFMIVFFDPRDSKNCVRKNNTIAKWNELYLNFIESSMDRLLLISKA